MWNMIPSGSVTAYQVAYSGIYHIASKCSCYVTVLEVKEVE